MHGYSLGGYFAYYPDALSLSVCERGRPNKFGQLLVNGWVVSFGLLTAVNPITQLPWLPFKCRRRSYKHKEECNEPNNRSTNRELCLRYHGRSRDRS